MEAPRQQFQKHQRRQVTSAPRKSEGCCFPFEHPSEIYKEKGILGRLHYP